MHAFGGDRKSTVGNKKAQLWLSTHLSTQKKEGEEERGANSPSAGLPTLASVNLWSLSYAGVQDVVCCLGHDSRLRASLWAPIIGIQDVGIRGGLKNGRPQLPSGGKH